MAPEKETKNNGKGAKGKNSKRKRPITSDAVMKKKKAEEKVPELVEGSESDSEPEPSSLEKGDAAMEWIISPTSLQDFYKTYWEKKPLHIKRTERNYFKDVFSTKGLEKILREQRVLYGKHMDITSYDGERETHNPAGRVYPAVMWDYFNNGASIRMINPQYFSNSVWRLCATLQEHFQCMVGANVYLTPPGTQGFAPHWDDVEVFMMQLEGKKHWRLYDPDHKLPRYSSKNLNQEDLKEPILEVEMEPGDLIYMPRGTIHQGHCLEGEHSLHITLSAYQLNSWTDLLEKLLPAALAVASQEDVEFRQGLPRNYLSCLGAVHSENTSQERIDFIGKLKGLMGKLFKHAPVDAAVDQLGKRLMYDALPPALELGEKCCTVNGDGEKWNSKKNCVVNRVEIDPDTGVRLVRSTACRMVQEEDGIKVYYSTENTREYHEAEEQWLEVDSDLAPAIDHLITSYPAWTKVEDLPVEDLESRMQVVGDLWEKGILITSEPLEAKYDDP
ncbi:ribosomal oxygenase 1 isoform X2 [Eurytemora carolleeae]|uniref:ribosomal oxygenase 1 isoform X2 n=1 Tax=Eurytemora carolleeae TaxID=1294199 RepID=UPI000C774F8C|nr:ribosomal oxygenase 1 isoform X2 [Eurytemora carolleeae]|eukprot:XP_023323397.1 ribosomal oxygenase 1-like isoform X2 [Eurytemora affinis]